MDTKCAGFKGSFSATLRNATTARAANARHARNPSSNVMRVNCNLVARLWNRLKEWRAVATRYEKTACSFMGVLCLAAAFDWIKT
jgi:hypothetical protein